ncbi:MAG TPA: KH domain-containing protein [Pyrinomonadaceae bacterium]|nr:KH domain-containing protein [Pyrinomonadaceae bacterium]
MRDVIEMIIKALVDDSETVDIREVEQRNGTTLIEVRVAPNDVGKIIGKQGKTIRALRSLARIAGAKKNRRYLLEIVE